MSAATLVRSIATGLALVALLYGAVLALLWFQQERLLFQPQVLPASHRFDTGPDVHEVWVDVPGARLNALHLRLPQPRGVVFFLHGNGGSLDNWFVNLDFYRQAGMDLFMVDYRGYGKSSGRITSEAQLHDDVRAAWRSVAPRYAGLPRVFFGRSLGTGLAAALAAKEAPELTVLVSPYFSMEALATEHYPWVPAAVLRYPLRTDQWLPQVRGPVLLVHGELDRLIEPSHSSRLQALWPASQRVVVPGAGHNDLQQFPAYSDALALALDALAAR
jgi:uncharacterized protein